MIHRQMKFLNLKRFIFRDTNRNIGKLTQFSTIISCQSNYLYT